MKPGLVQLHLALARGRALSWANVCWCLSSALLLTVAAGCGSEPAAAASSGAAASASSKPASAPALPGEGAEKLPEAPKSVFQAKLATGRDPFFPHLSRGPAKAAEAAISTPRLPTISYLKLVGIRPGTTRPMALINRTPFAPGEEGDVSIVVSNQPNKTEVQKVRIRCVEIRRESVLISIAGEDGVKELRMAQAK